MNELTSSAPRPPYDLDALRRGALSVRHPLTRALLVLTFTTGLIDAVSYLGLGHVFTANMTGNVVLLGFGIAGSGGLPVLAPIISLVAFLAGAVVGGILAQRLLERHPEHLGAALAVEVTLIASFFGQNFTWLTQHIGSTWAFWGLGVGGLVVSGLAIYLWLIHSGLYHGPRHR